MWRFRKKALGEKVRNPIQGEFFATDAIDGPAQALVRESVQNSLDARDGDQTVRVRLLLAKGPDSLRPEEVHELFTGAWPHYSAEGNGLHAAPSATSPCPYLVIEDFGTKGLIGDPHQADPDPDVANRNPFFLFFRAEGLSAKGGTELGRWGIGKFVFPRSSLASTHFGYTVRSDDKRALLLGAVTLKAHRVSGEASMFSPDGLYGKEGGGDLILPIDDTSAIESFCKLFQVRRRTESGLTVVVPFVDPEITFERLLMAAAKDYFLPILNGRLEIAIECGPKSVLLNEPSLESILEEYQLLLGEGIGSTISLARFALSVEGKDRHLLNTQDPSRALRWSEALVSQDALLEMQAQLNTGDPVAVRIPVTVRSKAAGNLTSSFDAVFVRDKKADGRPVYLREGIIISDVRGRRAREVKSIVTIDDKPLATMLGDSENPAHTQWHKDGSNFRGRYTYGAALISFVADSIGELVAILNRKSEQADPTLTVDYFSFDPPAEPDESTAGSYSRRPKPKRGNDAPEPDAERENHAELRPTRMRIARDDGGFSILPGAQPPMAPYLIEVRCAYDVRAGNAIKKWDSADFVLGSEPCSVQCDGQARVLQLKGNWALIRIDGPAFHTRFDGFDVNRDVVVRAEIRESEGANQAI